MVARETVHRRIGRKEILSISEVVGNKRHIVAAVQITRKVGEHSGMIHCANEDLRAV
jgi:hypothetical protein